MLKYHYKDDVVNLTTLSAWWCRLDQEFSATPITVENGDKQNVICPISEILLANGIYSHAKMGVSSRVVKFLENAGLILTSKFEVFWGFILKKPRFLPCNKPHDFHPQPQRCCPHPHLSFWGFLRVNLKWKFSRILNKPQIFTLFLCSFIAFFS